MKLVVIASFYLIVHARRLAPEIIVEWEPSTLAHAMDECVNITNVDPEVAKTMLRHAHLPNRTTFHCMHHLFHKHQGIISSDDQMIIPTVLEKIHSLTPELAHDCVEETDSIQEQLILIILVLNCYFAEVGRNF